jgi:hypothetical protein
MKRFLRAYVNPESTRSNEDFPAPEGPMMAVNCPELKLPDTFFSTSFFSANNEIKFLN